MSKAENELNAIKSDISTRQINLVQLELKFEDINATESTALKFRFLGLVRRGIQGERGESEEPLYLQSI